MRHRDLARSFRRLVAATLPVSGAAALVACGGQALSRAMQRIARDETRHASLAFEVDTWLRQRLDSAARARVDRARRAALRELAMSPGLPADVRAPLGIPSRRASRALAEAIDRLAAA